MIRKLTVTAAVALAAGLGLAACGSDSGTDTASIDVTGAWTRVTAPKQTNGAVYLTISSQDGDTLTQASVPKSIAGMAELHETTGSMGSDGGSMSTTEMDSMKGMKQVDSIPIPAGKTVKLEPGGYHIMLMELVKPITAGEKVPVTLTFAKAGTLTFDAAART